MKTYVKPNKGSLKVKKSLLDQKISIQMVPKPTKILKFLWIQILTLKNVMTIYYMTKKTKKNTISSDPETDFTEYDNIDYWIEDLQLTKVGENILLDPNKWLNDQHLGSTMQILSIKKLRYEQHTYVIVGKKCMFVKKYLQHIFINNNHWILVKIHMLIPNLHCIIYDSLMPMMKKLHTDTIQLLCKFINVNNLLYTYANVMQQIDNSSCGVFTITYATNIMFGFDPKKSQYVLTQMRSHLQNSINKNTSIPSQNIYPFKK